MKYTKVLRIVGIAVILSMLLAVTPAAPALAARSIELDIDAGKIGDTISISGEFFTASTDAVEKYVDIYFTLDGDSTSLYIDSNVKTYERLKSGVYIDEDGEFGPLNITVPDELDDGTIDVDVESGTTYYIVVTRYYTSGLTPNKRIGAYIEFTVGGGEITLAPEDGPVDTPLEITGAEFSASADIIIEYDGREVDIETGSDDKTDSSGDFESVILVPDSIAGAHTVTVTVGGTEVEAEFTVVPDVILAPTSGQAGDQITVSGTGFGKSKEVIIWFQDIGLATETTSRYGSFATTFIVPDLGQNIYDVEAEDDANNSDKVKFTITVAPPPAPEPEPEPTPPPTPEPVLPSVTGSISQEIGNVGTDLLLSGIGFTAGETVTIKYDHEEVATATVTAEGVFIAAFKVPVSEAGAHVITASDSTNTLENTFTMESEPPGTPVPLLPEMGVQVKSPILYDWEDVTDLSPPVTYNLQIATDDHFDAGDIVLEKIFLAESEYTLTEEEELEMAGSESPYFWRVRAVDAASNEGEWSGAGEFYVKSGLGIPSWAIYTLMGLGGLLLFAIGYLLGRRTTLYY